VAAALIVRERDAEPAALIRSLGVRSVVAGAGESVPTSLRSDGSLEEIPPVAVGGEPVSAARLRAAVVAGDLGAATMMLSAPYAVEGRVVHGFHRGATIGVPTANLRVRGWQLPPDGVYAVTATTGGFVGSGVANLGTNPTFGGGVRSLETNIFDFDGDLYGARLEVGFAARLRGERKFANVDELVSQIRRDITAARLIHARHG
jgi:riboflavin kinase/FMN adenylyltransferase